MNGGSVNAHPLEEIVISDDEPECAEPSEDPKASVTLENVIGSRNFCSIVDGVCQISNIRVREKILRILFTQKSIQKSDAKITIPKDCPALKYNSRGFLPIHEAVKAGISAIKKCVLELVAAESIVDQRTTCSHQYTPLHLAVLERVEDDSISFLLASGCNPLSTDSEGRGPLALCLRSKDPRLLLLFVQHLANRGQDLSTAATTFDIYGENPIMYCVITGKPDYLRIILEHFRDADVKKIAVNLGNNRGQTALRLCNKSSKNPSKLRSCKQILMHHGAKSSRASQTPIPTSSQNGHCGDSTSQSPRHVSKTKSTRRNGIVSCDSSSNHSIPMDVHNDRCKPKSCSKKEKILNISKINGISTSRQGKSINSCYKRDVNAYKKDKRRVRRKSELGDVKKIVTGDGDLMFNEEFNTSENLHVQNNVDSSCDVGNMVSNVYIADGINAVVEANVERSLYFLNENIPPMFDETDQSLTIFVQNNIVPDQNANLTSMDVNETTDIQCIDTDNVNESPASMFILKGDGKKKKSDNRKPLNLTLIVPEVFKDNTLHNNESEWVNCSVTNVVESSLNKCDTSNSSEVITDYNRLNLSQDEYLVSPEYITDEHDTTFIGSSVEIPYLEEEIIPVTIPLVQSNDCDNIVKQSRKNFELKQDVKKFKRRKSDANVSSKELKDVISVRISGEMDVRSPRKWKDQIMEKHTTQMSLYDDILNNPMMQPCVVLRRIHGNIGLKT